MTTIRGLCGLGTAGLVIFVLMRGVRDRPAEIQPAPAMPPSPVLAGVEFDFSTHRRLAPGSDNWPITWSDDDHLYTSWGDGGGFGGTNNRGRVSLGVGRVEGDWDDYTGHNVWGGADAEHPAVFPGKSYGMLSIEGALYMWVMVEGRYFEASELYYSNDKGGSWNSAGWKFEGLQSAFSVPTLLNYGRDYAGARDSHVYVYAPGAKPLGAEGNFPGRGRFNSADGVDLARVPVDRILDREAYEFFAGLDPEGEPRWTSDVRARQPVLEQPGRIHWALSVTHVPGIDRFILLNNGCGRGYRERGNRSALQVFDAPNPWGPWTLVQSDDPWGDYNYTFFFTLVPKWFSDDGREFTMVFTGGPGKMDSWNTVRGRFLLR